MSDHPPVTLSDGGRELWMQLLAQDAELAEPMNPARMVAIEACRAKDKCDELDEVVRSEPVMLDNGKGQPIAHPGWVESRQQANMLKQLLAQLRLPDEATGKRPQRRPGASGARKANNIGSAVSSLDRARAAKSS